MDVVGVRVEMPSNQPIVLLRETDSRFGAVAQLADYSRIYSADSKKREQSPEGELLADRLGLAKKKPHPWQAPGASWYKTGHARIRNACQALTYACMHYAT